MYVGADYDNLYRERLVKSGGSISPYILASPCDTDVRQLIKRIAMCNQPTSETDSYLLQAIFKTKRLSSRSVRKSILSMAFLVKFLAVAKLYGGFGLLSDGWLDGFVQLVAIFATYCVQKHCHKTLIAFSIPLQEDDMSAVQHLKFIKESLKCTKRA